MKFTSVVFAAALILGACDKADTSGPTTPTGAPDQQRPAASTPTKVDGARAKELVKGGAVLLDVRTQGEFDGGHIEGAMLIPVQELGARLDEVGARDKPVVVYCASGVRSIRASKMLTDAGWTAVYDLGSIRAW